MLHRLSAIFALAVALAVSTGVRAEPVTVFAAASLETVLADTKLRISYAGSGALARQIDQGAPADIFISANVAWMDWLERRGRIVPETRFDLLTNRLALVAPAPAKPVALTPDVDLLALLGADGRLAIALTESAPAGIYGKAALTSLGLWGKVQARVVETDNVRSALKLAARGEVSLAIVYKTDALAEPAVSILGLFPEATHPAIVYPVAAVTGRDSDRIRRILEFLREPGPTSAFEKHGFGVLADSNG